MLEKANRYRILKKVLPLLAVASLRMVTPGAELYGVIRLAKAINYSTFKGWRPVEGMSHLAERTLYCNIDIKNSELGRTSSLLACCISRDVMPKSTLTSFGAPFLRVHTSGTLY